jgi:protein-L-isoaspartate(D-aspartate) O-methyltransferase
MMDYATARRNMVENQLRPNRIDDPRIMAAMLDIPREIFVPKSLRGVAYGDADLDLGEGRWLIEPLGFGKLLQGTGPQAGDVALVIGCDTGYCSAVLSRLVATVFLLLPPERQPAAIEPLLSELGCDNVVIQQGPSADGLPISSCWPVR